MYRCAILDDYQNVALSMADWSPLEGEVETTVFNEHIGDPTLLAETLQEFDIVCLMRERTRFPAEVVNALPNLKLLITTGPRNNSVDTAALDARGITFCGTGGAAGGPIELTWAMILGIARSIPAESNDFHAGNTWQPRISLNLRGRRLGIVGFGRLGTGVARVGVAFGMDVVAWTPNLTDERTAAENVTCAASLDELLQTSDFVSIHVGLNPSTRGMIGARELGLMKPTAYLINTSRGPLVDEDALVDALQSKRIAGAALDVFDIEPLPSDHRLRRIDTVLGTPHIGYVTEAGYRVFFRDMVEDIAAWLKGEPVRVVTGRK